MVKLEVGKPLPGGLGPGPEGIAYEAPNGEHTLFVRLEGITDAEASAFRTAQARMALVSKGQSLFLCFHIEGVVPKGKCCPRVQAIHGRERLC